MAGVRGVGALALASAWFVANLVLSWGSLHEEGRLDKVGLVGTATVLQVHTRRLDPWPSLDVSVRTAERSRVTTVTGGFFASYEPGQQVRVQYNPEKVSEARLAGSRADLWAHLVNAALLAPLALLGAATLLWLPVANRLRPLDGRHARTQRTSWLAVLQRRRSSN